MTSDELRLPKLYDVRVESGEHLADPSDIGAVLNYSLFAAAHNEPNLSEQTFEGASASLNGQNFGPHGTFAASGIIRTDAAGAANVLRLDSNWTYSDQETLTSYRVDDTISGGPAWTRSIRIGGAQARRSFSLRPSLVTLPLPAVSGSAAVPSTVDIYVNNVKSRSQNVDAGPFTIFNIPSISGAGDVQVVIRDAAGREVRTSVLFFSSAKLLRKGLLDFSVEAGFARHRFGIESNNYADAPIGAVSARFGVSNKLTIDGHGEVAEEL